VINVMGTPMIDSALGWLPPSASRE
jgi:hypothetical protein